MLKLREAESNNNDNDKNIYKEYSSVVHKMYVWYEESRLEHGKALI